MVSESSVAQAAASNVRFLEGEPFAARLVTSAVQNPECWEVVYGGRFAPSLPEVVSGAEAPVGAEVWVVAGRNLAAYLLYIHLVAVFARAACAADLLRGGAGAGRPSGASDRDPVAETCSVPRGFGLYRGRSGSYALCCSTFFRQTFVPYDFGPFVDLHSSSAADLAVFFVPQFSDLETAAPSGAAA